MNWDERAERMTEKRSEYLETIKRDARAVLLFYLPVCFDSISKQIAVEVDNYSEPDLFVEQYENLTMVANIEMTRYPRATLRMLIKPPASIESCNAAINVTTKGLGFDNKRSEVESHYSIGVRGTTVVYSRLSNAGGDVEAELSLNDLVDDILGPFAEYIAT